MDFNNINFEDSTELKKIDPIDFESFEEPQKPDRIDFESFGEIVLPKIKPDKKHIPILEKVLPSVKKILFSELPKEDPRRYGIPEGAGEPIDTRTGKPVPTAEEQALMTKKARKPEGYVGRSILATGKAIPRVVGAVAGSLALLPGAGIRAAIELLPKISSDPNKYFEAGSISKAGKIFEEIMSVPGKLIKTEEETRAIKNIGYVMKPIEMSGEGWRLIGEAANEGLKKLGFDDTYIEPLLASYGEAAAIFALPGVIKRIRNSTSFRKMTIPERGLVVQGLADTIKKNPNMTEGQILKKYNNPMWRKEALKIRGLKPKETIFPLKEKPVSPIITEPLKPTVKPTTELGRKLQAAIQAEKRPPVIAGLAKRELEIKEAEIPTPMTTISEETTNLASVKPLPTPMRALGMREKPVIEPIPTEPIEVAREPVGVEKKPVEFIGMQEQVDKPPIPLVNELDTKSTVTYDPAKHEMTNLPEYEKAVASEEVGKLPWEGKQGWEMTKSEIAEKYAFTGEVYDHEGAIKKALKDGKKVPENVLAEYPHLKPEKEVVAEKVENRTPLEIINYYAKNKPPDDLWFHGSREGILTQKAIEKGRSILDQRFGAGLFVAKDVDYAQPYSKDEALEYTYPIRIRKTTNKVFNVENNEHIAELAEELRESYDEDGFGERYFPEMDDITSPDSLEWSLKVEDFQSHSLYDNRIVQDALKFLEYDIVFNGEKTEAIILNPKDNAKIVGDMERKPAKPLPPKLPKAKPPEAVTEEIKGEVIPKPTPEIGKPPKYRKVVIGPSKVRTLRGAIRELGGIDFQQFKGELETMDLSIKYLHKKTGRSIDLVEMQLKEDGWLYPDEVLLDVLADKKNLARDRIGKTALEKPEHELSPEEIRIKKEIKWEPEAPPKGEYTAINAEDLPLGKELTLIEGKSREGWDVYEVTAKDPFEITLMDGQEITLHSLDKVDVLKEDLAKPKVSEEQIEGFKPEPKLLGGEELIPKVKGAKKTELAALDKIERKATSKFEQDSMFEPNQQSLFETQAKKQQKSDNVEFFSGFPIHKFPKASKGLAKLYDDHVGLPIWNYLSETLPEKAGKRFELIDRINKGIILDYRKDPAFVEVRDDTLFKIQRTKEEIKELSEAIGKFSGAEQIRIAQIIKGGVTATPKRYEKAFEAIKKFQEVEKELIEFGLMGADNRFRKWTRKELATKIKEVEVINDKIKVLQKKLKPIVKTSKIVRQVSDDVSEEIISTTTDTKTGLYETKVTKFSELIEGRVKEALLQRGFAEGESTQMIARLKESVIPLEGKKGTLKEIKTTVKSVVTKTIIQEIEKLKTYTPSMMARARGSLVRDINKKRKERDEALARISLHYKMSGKLYLKRAYEKIESEKGFLSKLMGYVSKRPRLIKGYDIRRKDLSYEYRKSLGEIHRAPFLVYKGLSSETHDILIMEMFNKVAANKDWTISPQQLAIINSGKNEKLILKYENFKPLPVTDKLGKLSGQLVDPYIWDDLNQAVVSTNDMIKAWDSVLRLWKTGKVVYNPATQCRNMLSNIILADWGGLPLHRIDIYAYAARDFWGKSGYWIEAKKTPLLGTEWAGAEIKQFLKDTAKLKEGNMFVRTSETIKGLLDVPGKTYQGIEQFFKLAVFINERKAGRTIKQAAAHAEKAIFNYLKIPPAVRWAKRWYSPFITFSSKAMPRFAETVVRKPWKIAKYGIMMLAVEEITRRMYGESKEEIEQEKKVLPDYMRKTILPGQFSHLRIPYKDKYDRSKYLDLSFILPWGDIAEQWGQSHLVGRPFLPSHPFYISVAEIAFNEILFTGQELTAKDIDVGSEYWKKIGVQLWRQAVPSLAGSYSYNKLMAAYKGEVDWAMRDRSLTEAIFDTFFGLKVRSIDYTESRGRKLKYLRGRINVIKERFEKDYNKIIFDPTPDKDWNEKRTIRLYRKMNTQIDKILEKITEIESEASNKASLKSLIPGMVPWKAKKKPTWQKSAFGKKPAWQTSF